MAQVVKTPAADRDLGRIVSYIAQDNLSAALRWLEDTEKLFELLAEQPGIGQPIKTKRFGEIRRHVMGSYLIYYRPAADGIQILMISHGARDQQRLI